MIGHEQVIAVRMAGGAPRCVHFSLEPINLWAIKSPPCPDTAMFVQIDDQERIDRLDLRFLVGLRVEVQGDQENRVEALLDACMAHGADRCIATIYKKRSPKASVGFVPGYLVEKILKVYDTKGIFTWQE